MRAVHFIASVLAVAFLLNFCWGCFRRWQWWSLGGIRILYDMPPVYGWHIVGAVCCAGVWWLA